MNACMANSTSGAIRIMSVVMKKAAEQTKNQQSDDGHFRDGGTDSETAIALVKTHFPDVRGTQPRITELYGETGLLPIGIA